MKKFFKIVGVIIILLVLVIGVIYYSYNESLPEGESGPKAEELAQKMSAALHKDAYDTTEVFEWSFRDVNHYKWFKQKGIVEVNLNGNSVVLDLNDNSKSKAKSPELISEALKNFNNDSFWLVAPYKIFDNGVERKVVNYDGKDALLVTYTSGGSTPGDSYLWILDENYKPVSYKMWVQIIPLGGVSASWSDIKKTESGVYLPNQHKLSIFGMELDMGEVKAYNPKADTLANKILTAVNHDAYKNTRYLEWSFGGRRSYKWDKKNHVIDVSWKDLMVKLHPNDMDKSKVSEKSKNTVDSILISRALRSFNNDSFWLVAPHKLFDDGTFRNIFTVDGKEALKIKYTSGGSTPGDSYILILDKNHLPVSYQMHVPSMKMKGTPSTWEDWITTESGTKLPTMDTFSSGGKLSMGDVKGYN